MSGISKAGTHRGAEKKSNVDRLFCLAHVICADGTCKNNNLYFCSRISDRVVWAYVPQKNGIPVCLWNTDGRRISSDKKRNENISVRCLEYDGRCGQYPVLNIGQEKLSLLKTARRDQGVSVHDLRSGSILPSIDLRRTTDHGTGHGYFIDSSRKGKEAFVLKTIQADNAQERLYFVIGSFLCFVPE